jgi:hypothetical protein
MEREFNPRFIIIGGLLFAIFLRLAAIADLLAQILDKLP